MPDAAGGTGTIVFQTQDGSEFTEEQRAEVQRALKELAALDEVNEARDPFALQDDLDDAVTQLEDAREEIASGEEELADGRQQLEDGKEQLADGRAEVEDGRAQLEEARAEVADGWEQLEAGQAELNAGAAELEDGRAQLNSGRAQLEDGKEQLAAGEAQYQDGLAEYQAGAAQVADGREQLTAAEQQLEESAAQLEAGQQQYEAGVAELTSQFGVSTLEEASAALDAQQEQLDANTELSDAERAAAQEQIDTGRAGITELQESSAQLEAGRAELESGRQQLEAQRSELEAAAAQLPAAKQELDAARAELDAAAAEIETNEARLQQAAAEIAAGEDELAAGQAEIAENRAKLEAAEQEIADNAAQLDEAEATLDEEEAKLPEAEQELADGAAELEQAREDIALGTRQAAASEGLRFISEDGTTAAATIQFFGQTDALDTETRDEIRAIATSVESAGVQADLSQQLVQDVSEVFGIAEVIGLAIAAVVLLVMLGTVVAAGLPLIMAVLGVGVGVGGTLAFSSLIEMPSITPALALMLGLAVGIDYSLFIVHRHRTQLLGGMELRESIARATGTSGNAVVFAGLTVVIALAALVVPGLPFLSILGLSAAFTVAVAVLMSVTLTPAVLSVIGMRLLSRKARAKAAVAAQAPVPAAHESRTSSPRGWGAVVTRHPWLTTMATVLLLGAVALPATDLRTALPDGGAEPAGSTARTAYDTMSERFGAGYNGPLLVVADLPRDESGEPLNDDDALRANLDVADYLRDVDGVVAAVPASINEDNTVGILQVVPEEGPASEETEALVHELRDAAADIEAATGADVALTGQVAAQIDVTEKLMDSLPLYLTVVVGLSLVLLLLVFRSIVVPLLATAGFLLSLFAAFGATTAVYQWGWLSSVFGVDSPGPIMSFLPILLIGILFGLAMDYQVFLVSGMREAYVHGEDPRRAVTSGLKQAAPVVTAAALIMASVFAGFIFSHLTMIRALGFSLAVGVLVDAFLIRMTLTPAVMYLLGRHAWYLPKWLDKMLPDVDVEGAKLNEHLPGADSPRSPETAELPATSYAEAGAGSSR
nr:MMPL family transporter [Zhihengliuella flava]